MTTPSDDAWRATFEDAEASVLRAALDSSPAARLSWLEEAVRFAFSVGALPRPPGQAHDRLNAPPNYRRG